ncbi:MAG: sodium-independent anion transporter [Gammaproteobacteria bacterium]|nr:MAG: sodium-independent anion transporter [Deltaproteobacteria bacterium]PIE48142.1 MAG: sodium-independent anion transporter [Gammaproteobacteria bacterium]
MLTKVFPFLLWIRGYNLEKFKIDFISGLTVALVLIPQSMAYAQLAGLPPYYGLYAAFLPPMVAALFGSSRQLQTGPVAVVSLMTAASLSPLATAGSEQYIAYAVLLAITVGVFQFALGVLRLGLIVNFLSHPVVNGFTNAAALIIGLSQLSKLFGVYVDKAPHFYETIIRVLRAAFDYTHIPTLIMGVFAISLMMILKKMAPKIPNVLVAVVLTTLISYFSGFQNNESITASRIYSDQVLENISKFNTTVANIEKYGKERSEINLKLDSAKKKYGEHSVEYVKVFNKIEVLNLLIEEENNRQHLLRDSLRLYKFMAEKEAHTSKFYLSGDVPENVKVEDKVWRLKVGNRLLKEDSLIMMGGGAVVGEIPPGLPVLSIPDFSFAMFMKLLPFAVIISLLGFMEAIAIAKAMAAKTGQKLDPNQELIGQGLSNMIGAIGQSYPISGSFSRSAVNFDSGAVTGISSVITSFMVVLTLIFFTPLLYHLPQAVLAGVIMMAVFGLVNIQGFIHAWEAKKSDGIISILTFLTTLALAPHLEKGIELGVVLSLVVFLYNNMRPKVSSLAMQEDMSLGATDYHGLAECPHVAVVRFEGTLFFANATYLEDKVLAFQKERPELKHIIIACGGINDIDASGEEALGLLVDRVRAGKIDISFSGLNENVLSVFKNTHLFEKIGAEHIYGNVQDAVEEVFKKTHQRNSVYSCPLVSYIPSTEES